MLSLNCMTPFVIFFNFDVVFKFLKVVTASLFSLTELKYLFEIIFNQVVLFLINCFQTFQDYLFTYGFKNLKPSVLVRVSTATED